MIEITPAGSLESLMTQTLIIHVIRTNLNPVHSVASQLATHHGPRSSSWRLPRIFPIRLSPITSGSFRYHHFIGRF